MPSNEIVIKSSLKPAWSDLIEVACSDIRILTFTNLYFYNIFLLVTNLQSIEYVFNIATVLKCMYMGIFDC